MVSGRLLSDRDCPNNAVRANATLKFASIRSRSCEPKCNGLQIKCHQIKTRPNRARGLGGPMGLMLEGAGRLIARFLQRPVRGYEPFTPSDPDALRQSLEPGDVLLVEGNNHISGVIKYLTQSTWSHSALYVGPIEGRATEDGEPHGLIEGDCVTVCSYAVVRVGFAYDLKNIIDLMRYLLPLPLPQRWRRRMISL